MATNTTLYSCIAHPAAVSFLMSQRVGFLHARSHTGKMRIFFNAADDLIERLQRSTIVAVRHENDTKDAAILSQRMHRVAF